MIREEVYARCNKGQELIGSYSSGNEKQVEVFKGRLYKLVSRKSSGAFFEHDEHDGLQFYLFHNEYSVIDHTVRTGEKISAETIRSPELMRKMLACPELRREMMKNA